MSANGMRTFSGLSVGLLGASIGNPQFVELQCRGAVFAVLRDLSNALSRRTPSSGTTAMNSPSDTDFMRRALISCAARCR